MEIPTMGDFVAPKFSRKVFDYKIHESNNDVVTIRFKINAESDVYPAADGNWRRLTVPVADVLHTIAGLTVLTTAIDGTSDDVVIIEIKDEARDGGFVRIYVDSNPTFHNRYVLWSSLGDYDDEELQDLVERVQDDPITIDDEIIARLADGHYCLAMDMDGLVTLFRTKLPEAFLRAMAAFDAIARTREIRIVSINERNEK
jgi:hypothetical protein